MGTVYSENHMKPINKLCINLLSDWNWFNAKTEAAEFISTALTNLIKFWVTIKRVFMGQDL
jgi:hypothetical protein